MTLTPHLWALAVTAFLASGVEAVEALTIVLAVGITRGWGRALGAALAAFLVLAIVVWIAGPRLPALVAIPYVKLVVGLIALYVGYTWLRKAILRAAGKMAQRNESVAFAKQTAKVEAESPREAFATAFTGVLTEGVEVVAIVLALGSGTAQTLGAAAGGALAAFVAVVIVGLLVHRPLSQVPENAMKYVVGVMVSAFGVYWTGEGLRVEWPAADVALFYIAALVLLVAGSVTLVLRRGEVRA
ncbi:MAG TPA: hypothetical protein VGN14_14765 [Candidatus Elarobacter sp.]|jgi:uncharacterized membrane protein